jgi:hypothetical protein
MLEVGLDPDDPDTRDERFQFSLDCVLDGIAVRLSASQAQPHDQPGDAAPAGP